MNYKIFWDFNQTQGNSKKFIDTQGRFIDSKSGNPENISKVVFTYGKT